MPLPAGTYTVYPSVWTLSLQVHAAGRTHDVQPLSSEPDGAGAPFTVTVG